MHSINSFLDNENSSFHYTEQPLFLSRQRIHTPNRLSVRHSLLRGKSPLPTSEKLENFLIIPEELDFSIVKEECTYSMQLFVMMKDKQEEIRGLMNLSMEERETVGYFGKVSLSISEDWKDVYIYNVEVKGVDNYVVTIRFYAQFNSTEQSQSQKLQRKINVEFYDRNDKIVHTHQLNVLATILDRTSYEKYKRHEQKEVLLYNLSNGRKCITPVLGRSNKKLEMVSFIDCEQIFKCELPFPAHQIPAHNIAHLSQTRSNLNWTLPEDRKDDTKFEQQPDSDPRLYTIKANIINSWFRACERHNRTLANWGLEDEQIDEQYHEDAGDEARTLILQAIEDQLTERDTQLQNNFRKPLQVNRLIESFSVQ